jgi:hypothetical protein
MSGVLELEQIEDFAPGIKPGGKDRHEREEHENHSFTDWDSVRGGVPCWFSLGPCGRQG